MPCYSMPFECMHRVIRSLATAYDSITQLDGWTTSICLKIKKSMNQVPDLNSLEDDLNGGGPSGSSGPAASAGDDDELC